jgi:cytochrome c556
MQRLLMIALVTAGVFAAGTVAAQLNGDIAIRYRKQIFSAIGAHFSALNIIAKNPGVYDADLAGHAKALSDLSAMPWQAFGIGTDQGAEKTTADPKIWQDTDGFVKAQKNFQTEVAKLQTIVAGGLDNGGRKAISQQIVAISGTCKSCHEQYRR